jgi:hypothetical protein
MFSGTFPTGPLLARIPNIPEMRNMHTTPRPPLFPCLPVENEDAAPSV